MQSNFLTAKDIAVILKISRALSYRLISQGQIPSVRFGKTVRVKPDDLQEFIDRNTTNSSTVVLEKIIKV